MKFVVKEWGTELWIVNTQDYCGKLLTVNKDWQCSLHYHKIKDETFYVVQGRVLFDHGGKARMMYPGDSIRILPGAKHRFGGLEDSVIMEFSTHHDDADTYRDEPSSKME